MRPRCALLLALLASCQAERITTAPLPAVSFDAHAWRGGPLQLVSEGFDTPDSVRILLAGTGLPVQRLDSVTLVATLPDTTGTFDVQVEVAGRAHLVGPVTLHGGLLSRQTLPGMQYTAMAWPYGMGTFLVNVESGPARIDVVDGSVSRPFADSLVRPACGWGPWPAGNNAVVLAGPVPGRAPGAYDSCRLRVFRSDGQVVDSFPLLEMPWWNPAVRLADGSWVLTGGKGYTSLYEKVPGDSLVYVGSADIYEPWRMIASLDGIYTYAAQGFGPIVGGEKLTSPAIVHEVPGSQAAAFSGSGDTLAVQRYASGRPDSVFLVASRTGEVLAATPAAKVYTDLAFDSAHPWLYAARAGSGSLEVSVYDLRTMRMATVLRADGVNSEREVYLSLDVWHRRLNALVTGATAVAGLSFDLVP